MHEAIKAGDMLFAPWRDFRVQEVFKTDRDFTEFMQRFTDAFGVESDLSSCLYALMSRMNE